MRTEPARGRRDLLGLLRRCALDGRGFDADLLASLPPTVDPCGERGEFHTFAYAGPTFARPISIVSGAVVERGGCIFADVLPDPLASAEVVGV